MEKLILILLWVGSGALVIRSDEINVDLWFVGFSIIAAHYLKD